MRDRPRLWGQRRHIREIRPTEGHRGNAQAHNGGPLFSALLLGTAGFVPEQSGPLRSAY